MTEDELQAKIADWKANYRNKMMLHHYLGWTWEEWANWDVHGVIPNHD